MIEDLAPYQEGKYYNFRNLFFARVIYNVAGLKYIYDNHQRILKNKAGRTMIFGFVISCFAFDAVMIREYMRNRDRSDCMFQ